MITVKQIAEMCNVSPSTVSNILNGKTNMAKETKDRVLKAIEETGYRPNYYAQGMRRQNNKTICIIAEELTQFSGPPIVGSIMEYAESKGYHVLIINMGMYEKWKKTGLGLGDEKLLEENTIPAFLEAEAKRADGIIYLAAHGRVLDCVPKDYSIPVVYCYSVSEDNKCKSVIIDDVKSSYDAIDYLIKQNHKKIGVIAGQADNLHTVLRMQGYMKALSDNGINFDDSLIEYADWERAGGYKCAKKLIKSGVSAIWCMNDLMAAGVYDCMREKKLTIGKDVSVMGFDNREMSEYLYPKLSTSEIRLEEIGKAAARIMIKEIENEEYRAEIKSPMKVDCNLVIRDSVGRFTE